MGVRLRLAAALALTASLTIGALGASAQDFVYQDFETDEFHQVWERTDFPVQQGEVSRTWLWGPGAITGLLTEPYVEADDGERLVQYSDKSRMEMPLTAGGDPDSPWFITQGLLATELMTGQLQLGHEEFAGYPPAEIPVAGDPDDELGPTYATMGGLMDEDPRPGGGTITDVMTADGTIYQNEALTIHGVTDDHYDEVTGRHVASVFWDFMNSTGTIYQDGEFTEGDIFENPFYAVGRPLTDAYWAWVKVNDVEQNVLIQCFERRCLTYAPDNPEDWRVESGNIGKHYHHWRYEIVPQVPVADSFSVEPQHETNSIGQTHEITVAVLDQHGDAFDGAGVEAEVTATTGSTEAHLGLTMSGTSGDDGAGQVTLGYQGSEAGEDTITVTVEGIEDAQTVSKTWIVGDPASIEISQDDDENEVGETHTVTAAVEDEHGNPVPDGTEITFTITGANSGESGSADTLNGVATFSYVGETAGRDRIRASWNGVQSGLLIKDWTPGEPDSLVLTVSDGEPTVGDEVTLTATVEDEYGNRVPGVDVEFDSDRQGDLGTVETNSSGQAIISDHSHDTAQDEEITATEQENDNSDSVEIEWEANEPASVTVSATDSSPEINDEIDLIALVEDGNDNPVGGVTVLFTSDVNGILGTETTGSNGQAVLEDHTHDTAEEEVITATELENNNSDTTTIDWQP